MSILSVILGRWSTQPSKGLGGFAEKEASDLELHVSQCARRYDDLRASIDGVQILLWAVIALLLITRVIDLATLINLILK